MSNIKKLRKEAEIDLREKLKQLTSKHETALRNLFFMECMLNDLENANAYTEIVDLSKIDQAKLNEYLEKNKLNEDILDIEKSTSTLNNNSGQSPNSQINTQLSQLQPQSPNDQKSQNKKTRRVSLPPAEKMITRLHSGAIKEKSVAEIIENAERNQFGVSNSSTSNMTSPTSAASFKLPTVKLNIPQRRHSSHKTNMVSLKSGEGRQQNAISRSDNNPRSMDRESIISNFIVQPLHKLVQDTTKAVTSENWNTAYDETIYARILQRIEELKDEDSWSFEQIEPFIDPSRKKTHQDYLLDEMKWLAKDFKFERKWKIAAAFRMARWVMEWHNTEDKSLICVKSAKSHNHNIDNDNSNNNEISSMSISPPTSPNPVESLRNKIINLSLNDIVCTLETQDEQFYDIEKVFPEIPTYKPPKPSPDDIYIDEIHYHRIIPISKIMYKRPRKEKHSVRKGESGTIREYQDEDHYYKKIKNENFDETESIDDENCSSNKIFWSESHQNNKQIKNPSKFDTPKLRRNFNLTESIKRVSKIRQDNITKNQTQRRIHDQHISPRRIANPMELSHIKIEQERQVQAVLYEQRHAAAVAAYQGHGRPIYMRTQNPMITQGRASVAVANANHIQAFVMQRQAAALAQAQQQQQQRLSQQQQQQQQITPSVTPTMTPNMAPASQAQPLHVQQYYNSQLRGQQQFQF